MLIFKQEHQIAERILDNISVAYHCPVEACVDIPEKAIASALKDINFDTPRTDDLFYTRSILVSTAINLNTDHFSPLETWMARKTPIDKPTNINHNQSKIVGHITSQWVINEVGEIVPDDTLAEDIPEFFHIANGGVIYKKYPGEEAQQAMVDELIEDIEAGMKYVSMECLFKNFQYAIQDGENNYLVARNEETSFLSKHLRAYGGTGEYDGMKIARSLMGINFSGKGYVDEPANKDSIIFAKDKISKFSFAKLKKDNPFSVSNGVYFNCKANIGEKNMADNQDARIKELESALASLQKELADADSKALEARIKDLETELAESKSEAEKLSNQVVKEQEAKACMCDQVEKISAQNEKLKDELDKLNKEQTRAARLKVFLDKNFPLAEAEAEVDQLSALDDKTFAFVADKIPSKATEPIAPEKSTDQSSAEVEVETVEEPSGKTEASVDSDVDDELVARAALIKGIREHFNFKEEDQD